MFLLVMYLCDGVTDIVHLNYVINWKSFDKNKKTDQEVQVFLEEALMDVFLAQGNILDIKEIPEKSRGIFLKPLAGYYIAKVSKSAGKS